jgi:hypothetical protein
VFNLYDEDRSGDISMEEAQIMLNELYGEEFFKDGSNRGYVLIYNFILMPLPFFSMNG